MHAAGTVYTAAPLGVGAPGGGVGASFGGGTAPNGSAGGSGSTTILGNGLVAHGSMHPPPGGLFGSGAAAAAIAAAAQQGISEPVGARAPPEWHSAPAGTLIDAIEAEGGSLKELIQPFGVIDLVQLADVELYDLEELKEQLASQADYSLSNTMYKRLKRLLREHGAAASAAQARQEAVVAAKSTRKGKAAAAAASATKASGVAAQAAAALRADDEPVLAPGDDESSDGDADEPELPSWAQLPRLSKLLSLTRVSVSELLSLLASVLVMAKVEPFSATNPEVTAEQVEHNVLEELCGPELEMNEFKPKEGDARAVRAHVRVLMQARSSYVSGQAERQRAEAAENKAKAEAAERARVLNGLRPNSAKPRSLEHQRAHERIQAVVQSESALAMLQQLQESIRTVKGEQAFLTLKEEGEASFVELANLLHHEDIPLPSGASGSMHGLEGLVESVGHVGDMAAFVAVAANDVQLNYFKAVARVKLNRSSLDSVDNERLAKAAYFGKLTSSGAATGQFKLSELTNPADSTSIVTGKDKRVEARRLLDCVHPVTAALAAAHPRDRSVYDTMGLVHKRCLPEDGSEQLSPEVVDSVYGTFLRTYGDMWSQFQTSNVDMPTCASAWAMAQDTSVVRDAWQREQQREIAACKKQLSERDSEVKTLKTTLSALDARVKRLEQRPPATSAAAKEAKEGTQRTVINPRSRVEVDALKQDQFKAFKSQKEAAEKAEKAKAEGASDADALAKKSSEAKKVADAAKQAYDAARAENAEAQAKQQGK